MYHLKRILAGYHDRKINVGGPSMGVPQNGWFVRENTIEMDDLGGTPIYGNPHVSPVKPCFEPPNTHETGQEHHAHQGSTRASSKRW